ncbi:unnamed protein product [Sphagnum jensenii]|uniref:Uncharacterized protein n=1 Tax=Sphagnum jensenii TaxID=128206 RepID=A0ABP0W4P2_9BRYO
MDSMNRIRTQSSPRPASGRRVVAGKRTRPDETKNCVRKLLKREISRAGNLAFNRTNSQEKFWNFHLQQTRPRGGVFFSLCSYGVFFFFLSVVLGQSEARIV